MARISVPATGGTIATRRGPDGSAIARAGAEELVGGRPLAPGTELHVDDVFRLGSYRMTLEHCTELAHRVRAGLDGGADGVVVTHGTDTLRPSQVRVCLAALLGLDHAPGAARDALPALCTA